MSFTFGRFQFTVPSAPPDNVKTGMLNLTAGWVRWSPPPPQHHNGILLGYKIQVTHSIISISQYHISTISTASY